MPACHTRIDCRRRLILVRSMAFYCSLSTSSSYFMFISLMLLNVNVWLVCGIPTKTAGSLSIEMHTDQTRIAAVASSSFCRRSPLKVWLKHQKRILCSYTTAQAHLVDSTIFSLFLFFVFHSFVVFFSLLLVLSITAAATAVLIRCACFFLTHSLGRLVLAVHCAK